MTFKNRQLAIISLILLALLLGCRPKSVQLPTMDPTELAVAQTKFAFQQGTKAAFLTQTRVAMGGESFDTPITEAITDTPDNPISLTETPVFDPSMSPNLTAQSPTSTLTLPNFSMSPTHTLTGSPIPTSTIVSNPTQTPTRTSTLSAPIGWAGVWTAYMQTTDGSYQTGQLTVTINGEDVTGELTLGAKKMTLVGKIYADGEYISGIFSLPPQSGRFYWENVNTQQFGGNTDNLLAFCAARPGSQQPNPCGIFIPS